MLNVWPWSRIRELEERLELAEREWKKREVWLGNCAKECRFYEDENLRLEKKLKNGEEQYHNLKKDFWNVVDERNRLLDLLAISPRAWKRKRIELRHMLKLMYRDFGSKSAYSLWVKKPASLFKVFAENELPEPLDACPRCSGEDAELIRTEDGLCYVQCRKCGTMTDDCKHAEDAVEMWNEGRVIDE